MLILGLDPSQSCGWPQPFIVVLRNHMAAQGIDVPLPTIAANGMHIGLAEPVIMNGRKGNQAKPVSTEPVPTLDTKGGVWLAEPLVLSPHNSGAARSADDPLPTITTGGAGTVEHPGCARPMLVTVAHGTDARDKDPYSRRAHDIEEPLGAVHGDGSSYAVVEPFVLSQASGGSPRAVDEPLPTSTTGGSGGAHALISPYYGSGSGETCQSSEEPLPTVTAKGRFGMVVPVTQSNGGATARNVEIDPLATMTTAKGGEFALAEATEQYDILFRMLEPHELAAAMGFDEEDRKYEFAGTKTDKIKQISNAVSVSKMKACVGAIMADAAPKQKAAEPDFREAAE